MSNINTAPLRAFKKMTAYPDVTPATLKTAFSEYKGKVTVVHLYTS